jgi:hypothetical protein
MAVAQLALAERPALVVGVAGHGATCTVRGYSARTTTFAALSGIAARRSVRVALGGAKWFDVLTLADVGSKRGSRFNAKTASDRSAVMCGKPMDCVSRTATRCCR